MSNIAVSSHGGRWSTDQPTLVVPAGSSVVFFVPDGGLLSNTEGYKILANLSAGKEPGGPVAQTVLAGAKTYDYSCWYAPDFAAKCGIFAVGSGARVMDLSGYTEDSPLLLSEICAAFPDAVVYWVACRQVTTSVGGFDGQQANDVFPGPEPS